MINIDKKSSFYARYVDERGGFTQSLALHLLVTGRLCSRILEPFGLSSVGTLLGLLHDAGKYTRRFQVYLAGACGAADSPWFREGERSSRGEVDHSAPGAQLCEKLFADIGAERWMRDLLEAVIAGHHGGLPDMLDLAGDTPFYRKRLWKEFDEAGADEAERNMDSTVRARICDPVLLRNAEEEIAAFKRQFIDPAERRQAEKADKLRHRKFRQGLLLRLLFSALVDADRLSAAGVRRLSSARPQWEQLAGLLEGKLAGFAAVHPESEPERLIAETRRQVSDACLAAASRPVGTYSLTVPTGGGKTLASLRFALHHAALHGLDRIIYIVPYTAIISQNAEKARRILEPGCEPGSVVLEHHSNLLPEKRTEHWKGLTDNWNAPVIFTTMVQFLNTLFSAGTGPVRRFHALARSVIIFDEIQSLPVRTVHMFNQAANFLAEGCGSTLVMCTATQPLLDRVDARCGALNFSASPELMADPLALFRRLKRVELHYQPESGRRSEAELAEFVAARAEEAENRSALLIVNHKVQAKRLYRMFDGDRFEVLHLTTDLCPAHRDRVIGRMREALDLREKGDGKPLVVVSTSLIECGVDVDFGAVVRLTAGFDAVIQAAGRCNRHGRRESGDVWIWDNPAGLVLPDEIAKGARHTERLLGEFLRDPEEFENDLLHPRLMERYFKYWFYDRSAEMGYPVKPLGKLLELFSGNPDGCQAFLRRSGSAKVRPGLFGMYRTVGERFEAIDDFGASGVLVPWEEGKELIAGLCATADPLRFSALLARAQRYSVNLSPYRRKLLAESGALSGIGESGVLCLDPRYYDKETGVSPEEENRLGLLSC